MSWEVQAVVWAAELPSNEKWVLMGIANYVDQENKCWPSIDTLGRRLGLSAPSVINNVKRLEERGILVKDSRAGRSTVYHVKIEVLRNFIPPESEGIKKLDTLVKKLNTPPIKKLNTNPDSSKPVIKPQSSADAIIPSKEPNQRDATDYFCSKYLEAVGSKYNFKTADGVNCGRLFKKYGLEEFKRVVDLLFSTDDPFILKNQGRTVASLIFHWNKLVSTAVAKQPVRSEEGKKLDPFFGVPIFNKRGDNY